MLLAFPPGATPVDPDEAQGLIPSHITMQEQLNEWEQANILEAENWAFSRKHPSILTIKFCKLLHKKMFQNTWKWAGEFRQSNKNIGGFWEQVSIELKKLFDDVEFQLDNKTYSIEEIAARFHHRLVFIHPFPNGNGRHARLMTDLFMLQLNEKLFSWGRESLISDTRTRKRYIDALRKADRGEYKSLIDFVRS